MDPDQLALKPADHDLHCFKERYIQDQDGKG